MSNCQPHFECNISSLLCFGDGAVPAVDDDAVAGAEGGGGADRADHAGQPVLAGHHGAVRDQPAQLGDDAAQQREVGAPADVRAYGDQNVALRKNIVM